MKATKILMDEHRVIEQVLDALEVAANSLAAGRAVPAAFFLKAADFIKNFADGCHHRKEEGVLFIALNANGMPSNVGPVAVMLAEHEEGRQFTRAMWVGAELVQAGTQEAAAQVSANALGYTALLRQHIQKEDQILFPMAEQRIPATQQGQVAAEFERLGEEEAKEGIQTKYRALAAELASLAA